jgi:hypothetical protein
MVGRSGCMFLRQGRAAIRTCGLSLAGGGLMLVSALSAGQAAAQAYGTPSQIPADAALQMPDWRPHDFSFIPLPIPVSDPAIGDGLALAAGLLYKAGGSERPWTSGAGGLYTDSGSWAALLFQKAYIGADRFRLLGAAGLGEFNVDFYGIGSDAGSRGFAIPISQEANFAVVQGLMRVAPHTYAGLQYRRIEMATTFDLEVPPEFPDMDIPERQRDSQTSALGVSGEYDTRDNEYQPTSGLYGTALWLRAAEALGSDHDYSRAEFEMNGYTTAGQRAVWAWRGSACWAGDAAPFYDICNFGSQSDLRGYVQGRYRDHSMFAVQAEYRRKFSGRFGFVLFAGMGAVAPGFGEMDSENLLPAAGIGLRYEASRRYRVNIGVDYAVGVDSSAFYFRAGEAF